MTAWILERLGLQPLEREAVPVDGAVLRIAYGPTFHRWVAVVVRRFGDVAELEVIEEEGANPHRVMLDVDEAAAMIARLPAPLTYEDPYARDGIVAYAERWDGRELVIAAIPNPPATSAGHRLLVAGLDLAEARVSAPSAREALAAIRGYLADRGEALCPGGQTRARRRRSPG